MISIIECLDFFNSFRKKKYMYLGLGKGGISGPFKVVTHEILIFFFLANFLRIFKFYAMNINLGRIYFMIFMDVCKINVQFLSTNK